MCGGGGGGKGMPDNLLIYPREQIRPVEEASMLETVQEEAHKPVAELNKKLNTKDIEPSHLLAFLADRLIQGQEAWSAEKSITSCDELLAVLLSPC